MIAVEPDDRRFAFSDAAGNLALIRSHHGASNRTGSSCRRRPMAAACSTSGATTRPIFPARRLAPRAALPSGPGHSGRSDDDRIAARRRRVRARSSGPESVRSCGLSWRNAALQWARPFPLKVDGHAVIEASGTPSLIQSRYGAKRRNFELVTPRADGGLIHLWRNNDSDDSADWRWGRAAAPLDPTGTTAARRCCTARSAPTPATSSS